jgi:transcriptional regulator with XRE-family HTH domain
MQPACHAREAGWPYHRRVCDDDIVQVVEDWSKLGSRVREARLASGLSQMQLADRVGLDANEVVEIESGDRRVEATELFRLADTLALPIDHFIVEPPAAVLSFRTSLEYDTDSNAARDAYRMEALLLGWLRDVEQMIEMGFLQVTAPPNFGSANNIDEAREIARRVRVHLDAANAPLGPMAQVCESLGLLVLVTDIPGDGASVTDNGFGVAVVSQRGEPGRRRATAAHELGHQLLGDSYSSDLGVHVSRGEREALVDAFAAEFLVPAAALSGRWPHGDAEPQQRTTAVRLSAEYRVSWSLLLRQLGRAELAGKQTLERWRNRPPTRAELLDAAGWVPAPDLADGQLPPSYARSVLHAWEAGEISAARTVELLHGQVTLGDLPVSAPGRESP